MCNSNKKRSGFTVQCKIKKVKTFKPNEQWFLPPDNIQVIKRTVEAALKNAKYSVDPVEYFQAMKSRYDAILELERVESDCVCGLKLNGKVVYIPNLPNESEQ